MKLPVKPRILTIAVGEKVGRFGLGWRLMQAAIPRSEDRGGEAMFLEVDDGNAPALGLYRKLGFEKAGERPAYYTDEQGAGPPRLSCAAIFANPAIAPTDHLRIC